MANKATDSEAQQGTQNFNQNSHKMSKEEKEAQLKELSDFFKRHRKGNFCPKHAKIKVPEIKANQYKGSDISQMIISNKIVIIRKGAFANCKYLKKLMFSENSQIKVIESGSFRGCKRLTEITFPKKIINVYGTDIDFGNIQEWKIRKLIKLMTTPIKERPKAKKKKSLKVHTPRSVSPNEAKGRHYNWYKPK